MEIDESKKEIKELLVNERAVREHFLNRSLSLNLLLVEGQEAYPDLHMRDVDTGEDVFVEVEHLASNFLKHGHHNSDSDTEADYIVCGTDDLDEDQRSLVPPVIALDEEFGAEIDHTPKYRLASYISSQTRRKSLALKETDRDFEVRFEDHSREQRADGTFGPWIDDSKGTIWMTMDDFGDLFETLSNKMLDGENLGQLVFAGDQVDYSPLVEFARQKLGASVDQEGDSVTLARVEYRHPRLNKEYIAKVRLKKTLERNPPNLRIQHYSDGGSQHESQRTTVLSYTEFPGLLNKFDKETRKELFIEGNTDVLLNKAGISLD